MRKKVIKMNESGKVCKAILKLRTPGNHAQGHYPQMENTWSSGEPSQKWSAYQNDKLLHEVIK